MAAGRVPVAVPFLILIIGVAFVIIGLTRPEILWNLGKVRLGREWFGETGMTLFFAALGVALGGVGVALLVKR